MAGIFTVKGFNPSQSTQTFVCDGSLNLSPSQCIIIINADTETHNTITLQFRARFLGSNLSSAFKTLLTIGDSSGTGSSTSSTRDSSKKWLIGAYMQSSSESYRNPYSLELDLDSLKITLDGTEYTLERKQKEWQKF